MSDTIFFRPLGKGQIAVVDEQLVGALSVQIIDPAYVDIQQSIAVYIGHGNAGGPPCAAPAHAGRLRDILKLKIALIQIQSIGMHIGGKINISQTIVVNITDRHPSTIIKI